METVRVKGWSSDESHKDGVLINKSDFDPEKHELFDAPKAPESDLLKGNTAQVIAGLPGVDLEGLQKYLEAEKASARPRTGVVSAIEAEIATRQAPTT